ncbi:MAG TPA: translation initiation factor IF-2 N-terminal domain-containing protein, partial [Planctomycetota bacterium]|nr:translation initiation factor IF-2 N-terminal domain-containing protein [Planctomycetota bacterium]
MRVSELAKELGYKAAELVELARAKGIRIEDARANLDARMAAAVRAQVPHRSKLTGALMEVYARVVADEAARAAAKAAEPKPPRKEAAEGEAKPKRPPRKKAEAAAPAAPAEAPAAAKTEAAGKPAAAPAPPAAKPAKKVKVVEEFRLADAIKAAPAPKPSAPKTVELSPEEQEELKKEAAKPLIDVDKVIG